MSNRAIWTQSHSANEVEIVKEETLYAGHYHLNRYQLRHHTFDGQWGPLLIREQVIREDATAVVLYDAKEDKVVMVEQFRVGPLKRVGAPTPWLLEIPAGINDHASPAEVAIKEVQEETGLSVSKLIPIGEYYTTPGGFSEKIYLFCGIVSSREASGIHGVVHEGEEIKVVVLSFQEVWHLLQKGLVTSSSTYIALQWLALNRETLSQGLVCENQNEPLT